MPSCNGIMPSDGSAKPKEEEGGTPLFDIDPSGLPEILSPLDTKRVRSSAERWGIIGDDLSSGFDKPDGVYYSERWKGTPRSGYFEPHPFVGEAWEALRRSVLHLRGQPVEIVAAALDNYSEEFNDDQINLDQQLVSEQQVHTVFQGLIEISK